EPIALDHGPGRARDFVVAEQGRRGHQATVGLGLRAHRPSHASPSLRTGRRSGRAPTRREKGGRHPRVPLLDQARRSKEEKLTGRTPDLFRPAGRSDALQTDFVAPYYLDALKRGIWVARVEDRLYAFDDLCTCAEQACPLSGGLLTGTTLMCQCHGSRFDLTTGTVIDGPATTALRLHEVREVEGTVQIRA